MEGWHSSTEIVFSDQIKEKMANKNSDLIPEQKILKSILAIRGEKVILDSDLAKLYGVETRRLNE